NFSEISTAIRDPISKQPYPGNIIPSSQLSSIARNILQFYPLPNRPGIASNLQPTVPNTDNVDQLLVRGDQNIGNKIRLSVRYNWHDSVNSNVLNALLPTQVVTQPRVNNKRVVSYTHALGTNLFNDFRIGYHRVNFDTLNDFAVNNLTPAGSALGIPCFDGDARFRNPVNP